MAFTPFCVSENSFFGINLFMSGCENTTTITKKENDIEKIYIFK